MSRRYKDLDSDGYKIVFGSDGRAHRTGGPKRVIIGVTDEQGNMPKRTKWDYPYSYDPICHYLNDSVKVTGTVYDDRLYQWNYEKFNEVCEKVKQEFPKLAGLYKHAPAVTKLLQLYMDDPTIKLGLIVEYCNVSNGFANFRFDYSSEKDKPTSVTKSGADPETN